MVTFDVIEDNLELHPFSNLAVQTVSSNFHFAQLRKGMHFFLPTLPNGRHITFAADLACFLSEMKAQIDWATSGPCHHIAPG